MEEYINGKDTTIKIVLLREFSNELAEILKPAKVKSEFEK